MSDALTKNNAETLSAKKSRVQQWLENSASKLSAHRGLILVKQGDRLSAAAKYPLHDSAKPSEIALQAAARRAFDEKQVIVRLKHQESNKQSASAFVAFSLRLSGRPAVIAFEVSASVEQSNDEVIAEVSSQILRRAEDKAALPNAVSSKSLNTKPEQSADQRAQLAAQVVAKPQALNADPGMQLVAEQSAVIGALSTLLDQRDFAQALHALADTLAQAWSSLRVTIALVHSRSLTVEAVSGSVDFDPRSALMVDIVQALEETRTAAASIMLPSPDKELAPPQCHAALAAQLKDPALLSLPLIDEGQVVGAILMERDRAFSAQEQKQLEAMAVMLAPVVALKRVEAMGVFQWSKRLLKKQLRALFGAKKLGWKLSALAACAFILWASVYTQTFKIDADAVIEASVQRAVVAGFPSFIEQVDKRAGDLVYKGDVLARLDVEDLQLDRIKWVGERDKLAKEHRANLAQRDRSKLRILDAQLAQAQAQLDLIDAQIARATLRAPIDGVVISGDLSQALRSPVERGQLLFEVASLDNYRLILKVDESDIGWVKVGGSGQLRLRSTPDQTFAFTVTSISPVSEAGEGANRFRVEASLGELPVTFRPGMEGVAKVEIEPRAIGWIWTRSFMNWLKMQSWKYGW